MRWSDQAEPPEPPAEDPLDDVVRAVREDDPLGYLAHVSSIVNAFDLRNKNPYEGGGRRRSDDDPDIASFVDALTDFPVSATTYLCAGLAELLPDELLAARCRHTVTSRNDRLPPWLDGLGATQITGVVEQVHVLGDGDNIIIGLHLAGGHDLTLVVFVDHNLGHVCKDAFPIPLDLEATVAQMRQVTGHDPDITWTPLDPAVARARVSEAVDLGAITWPPFESDTWPAARPLLEWVLAKLPDGGAGYRDDRFSEDEIARANAEVLDRFWRSAHSRGVDGEDGRSLLETLTWFGTDYGSGDLLQWSPVRVELLLADWLPRKVVAPRDHLAKAPPLVKAFVRFCHAERGISDSLTTETLDAVDAWTPHYLQLINESDRPTGLAEFVDAHGLDDSFVSGDALSELLEAEREAQFKEMLEGLLTRFEAPVGGAEALDSLDTSPLPDEPMDFTAIPDDIRGEVEATLSEIDRVCDEILDVEYRTACRRLLAAAASGNPAVFRQRARPANSAAAVVWVVGKANHLFRRRRDAGLTIGDMTARFGTSSPAQRARSLVKAVGGDASNLENSGLGDARYLVSTRRAGLIGERDRYRKLLTEYG